MQEHVIAKKYAKALAGVCNTEEISQAHSIYAEISRAFNIDKFCNIVASPIISNEKKLAFLKSFINITPNIHVERLLEILVYNDRVILLPFLVLELKKIINIRSNVYQATLHVGQELDKSSLSNIESKLGKRLNTTLQITQNIEPKLDGIRLEVTELGIEVAFLKDKFTQELQDFILKAI